MVRLVPFPGFRYLTISVRFVVGESVEENANLVVRLLIRRPECLGPALRGGTKPMVGATRRHRFNSQQVGTSGEGVDGGAGGGNPVSPGDAPGSPDVPGTGSIVGGGGGGVADDAHSTTASNANTQSSSAGGGLLKGAFSD